MTEINVVVTGPEEAYKTTRRSSGAQTN